MCSLTLISLPSFYTGCIFEKRLLSQLDLSLLKMITLHFALPSHFTCLKEIEIPREATPLFFSALNLAFIHPIFLLTQSLETSILQHSRVIPLRFEWHMFCSDSNIKQEYISGAIPLITSAWLCDTDLHLDRHKLFNGIIKRRFKFSGYFQSPLLYRAQVNRH